MAMARKVPLMDRYTRSGQWQARVQVPVRRVAGKTLGLIGFGRTAQEVARRARAFDLRVMAYAPRFDREAGDALQVSRVELKELLRCSDFVSLHVPLTAETQHLIGDSGEAERQFRREADQHSGMIPNTIGA